MAAAVEEEDDGHEQELFVVAVESSVLLFPLPDALGVALSGKITREEEEHDMATAQSRSAASPVWVAYHFSNFRS